MPSGVLINTIIDSKTRHKTKSNVATDLSFEIVGVYLPCVKFAKGSLKSLVKLSDNAIEFTQGKGQLAKRVKAYLPDGFRKIKGHSHNEDIFTNGKVFITPDNTSHIGGTWKAAKKIEHLGSKTKKLGTYDENFVKLEINKLSMDKLKNIEFIKNLSDGNNSFFEELEKGIFNKSIFHDYTKSIYELSKLHLTSKERYDCAILIWEINHHIQNLLISHFNIGDIFQFNNLEEDDNRQLKNILFYTANWFSYEKEMDLKYIKIGGWE